MSIYNIIYNRIIVDIKRSKILLNKLANSRKNNTNKILKIRENILNKQALLLFIENINTQEDYLLNMDTGNKYYINTDNESDDNLLDFIVKEVITVLSAVN